jgi:hypothetical protein|uniref:DUF5672 domain-containing protein n=1 Tax=Phaeodactylum tricornutum TaxID=2850 RepID=A0A8J9X290_PHATR
MPPFTVRAPYTSKPTSSNCLPWTIVYLLLIIVASQWALLNVALNRPDIKKGYESHSLPLRQKESVHSTIPQSNREENVTKNQGTSQLEAEIQGVFTTVLFRAPKWFHLRYLGILHNALSNLPPHWKLHIFINEEWIRSQVYPWQSGLQRFLMDPPSRVKVTPLPPYLTRGKPKQILVDQWFWNSLLADHVLIFSGNGAFCGNHMDAHIWNELNLLDYGGTPWSMGVGGDGSSHSIRNRHAMLKVIVYANSTGKPLNPLSGREHDFFVNTMKEMNEKNLARFTLASVEQTVRFGGVTNLANETGTIHVPLVAAGTQARLSYEERDSLLKHCPEIKMIFPSLHEPASFGAHPNPEKCRASICALQDNIPNHGC